MYIQHKGSIKYERVIVNITILLFSSTYNYNYALQVSSFRDVQEDGVVPGLSANLGQAESSVGVAGGVGEHSEEIGLADVIGAGAGDQNSAGAQHLQRSEIEFFIAAEGGIEVALGFGEGGRIENNGVVVLAGRGIVLEQIEGVGFDPFDFFVLELQVVERGILVGAFERGPGAVDSRDMRAARGQMESKTSLVAEDVKGFAVGVLGSGSVILTLVKERSGLLAFERIEVELDGVHGEDRGDCFALEEAGWERRQILELADARVHALDDGSWMKPLGQLGNKGIAYRFRIHSLGENLHRENVVVAVDNETGQEISFAEDYAVGIGVVDDGLAKGDGVGDALAEQRREVGDGLVRDQADSDLRRAGIERGAEGLAAMIHNADQGACGNALGRNNVGAVDPDVTVLQARCAARRDGDFEGGIRSRWLSDHASDVNRQRQRIISVVAMTYERALRRRKII